MYQNIDGGCNILAEPRGFKYPDSFKGIYRGVFVLVILQIIVGAIHLVSGLALAFTDAGEPAYAIYTLFYGAVCTVFAYGLWAGKTSGWLGTNAVSLFVIVVDVCTVLGVPLIPGVPRSAAPGEIAYSLAVLVYLLQPKIVKAFKKTK